MINKRFKQNERDGVHTYTKMGEYIDTIPGTNKKPEETMRDLKKGPDPYANLDYTKPTFEVEAQRAKNKNAVQKFKDNGKKINASKAKQSYKTHNARKGSSKSLLDRLNK